MARRSKLSNGTNHRNPTGLKPIQCVRRARRARRLGHAERNRSLLSLRLNNVYERNATLRLFFAGVAALGGELESVASVTKGPSSKAFGASKWGSQPATMVFHDSKIQAELKEHKWYVFFTTPPPRFVSRPPCCRLRGIAAADRQQRSDAAGSCDHAPICWAGRDHGVQRPSQGAA